MPKNYLLRLANVVRLRLGLNQRGKIKPAGPKRLAFDTLEDRRMLSAMPPITSISQILASTPATAPIKPAGISTAAIPFSPTNAATLTERPNTAVELAGDFVQAGRTDIVSMDNDGTLWVEQSTGSGFQATIWAQLPPISDWARFFVGDFNGDGRDDIAALSTSGTWVVGISTGTRFVTSDWAQWSPANAWASIQVGDFTGNGRADVAALSTAGTWYVGVSSGTKFVTSTWAQWLPATAWASIQVGDFNGNGRTDVAGLTTSGAWVVGISTGSSFSSSTWVQWSPANTWASIQVGDFNGNGRTDVAGLTTSGTWVVGLSTGKSFTDSVWAQWSATTAWTSIEVGNFSGNSLDDIAATAPNGAVYVAASTGSSFQSSTWATLSTSTPWQSVLVGNFAGNYTTDLAVLGQNRYWTIAVSDGQQFQASQWNDQYSAEFSYYAAAPQINAYSSKFLVTVPIASAQSMFFNYSTDLSLEVDDFKGVLRGWAVQAEQQSIKNDKNLQAFILAKLNAFFPICVGGLEALYPGLTTTQYKLLMAMNLVDGYYELASTIDTSSLANMLAEPSGACAEIAALTASLANMMGIAATREGVIMNYNTNTASGQFYAGHEIVIADGMWIDSEINVAFEINMATITAMPPLQRLAALVKAKDVFGFYNSYLEPEVRIEQIDQGQDGGDIAYYYYWYLGAIGQGQYSMTAYANVQ